MTLEENNSLTLDNCVCQPDPGEQLPPFMEKKMTEDANALFDVIQNHKEEVDWVLKKQAELRAELMTFYKKDLKEIQSSLNGHNATSEEAKGYGEKALQGVQQEFIKQWLRSYEILTPPQG